MAVGEVGRIFSHVLLHAGLELKLGGATVIRPTQQMEENRVLERSFRKRLALWHHVQLVQ